jgi:hypothetical protein
VAVSTLQVENPGGNGKGTAMASPRNLDKHTAESANVQWGWEQGKSSLVNCMPTIKMRNEKATFQEVYIHKLQYRYRHKKQK